MVNQMNGHDERVLGRDNEVSQTRLALVCHPFTSFRASSERSEGSGSMGCEMLRCAQHDIAGIGW
jgi:hypothetical protein